MPLQARQQTGNVHGTISFRIHPENTDMRRVEVDPEILSSAINDAINLFVREVLIPRGLVDAEAYYNDLELVALQHKIAEHWVEHWKVCWKDDDAPEDQPGK